MWLQSSLVFVLISCGHRMALSDIILCESIYIQQNSKANLWVANWQDQPSSWISEAAFSLSLMLMWFIRVIPHSYSLFIFSTHSILFCTHHNVYITIQLYFTSSLYDWWAFDLLAVWGYPISLARCFIFWCFKLSARQRKKQTPEFTTTVFFLFAPFPALHLGGPQLSLCHTLSASFITRDSWKV